MLSFSVDMKLKRVLLCIEAQKNNERRHYSKAARQRLSHCWLLEHQTWVSSQTSCSNIPGPGTEKTPLLIFSGFCYKSSLLKLRLLVNQALPFAMLSPAHCLVRSIEMLPSKEILISFGFEFAWKTNKNELLQLGGLSDKALPAFPWAVYTEMTVGRGIVKKSLWETLMHHQVMIQRLLL